jgi:hypothetical protein
MACSAYDVESATGKDLPESRPNTGVEDSPEKTKPKKDK